MKTCPYCAEQILDAAVVCKHCHRDLVTPTAVAVPAKKKAGPLKILMILAGIILGVYILTFFVTDSARFAEFKQQREAWHQRCDARREAGRAADPEAYDACADELEKLMAEAKSEGWLN